MVWYIIVVHCSGLFHWQPKVGDGLCPLWWTPKCSTIKVSTTILGMFYTCTFRSQHQGWSKHVLHICNSYDIIGGDIGVERGKIKCIRGDKLLKKRRIYNNEEKSHA